MSRFPLSLRDINTIFTQNHHLFEEPSPFQWITFDLDEAYIEHLTISQPMLMDLDLAV
jgi:hypothetical protein